LATSTGTEPGPRPGFTGAIANLGLRGVISVVFLGLAALILLLVLVWTVTAAGSPSAAGCHNAPLRVTRVPQLVGILICVAGFVLGRITARPKVDSRSQVRSWVRDRRDRSGNARAAILVSASLTAALLFITFLIAFEAITLNRGVWPITYYMRCASEAATWQTLAAAFAFCLLTGRWMWLPTTPKDID
jgi:hypothetical protein